MTDIDHSRGAQRVVDYLGVVGMAALADLEGELHLTSVKFHGGGQGGGLHYVAQLVAHANRKAEPDPLKRIVCLPAPSACAYYASVGSFILLVVASESMLPAAVIERMTSAVAIFDRVMARAAVPSGSGSGGTPDVALAFAEVDGEVERGS